MKEVSLLDQGSNAQQSILALEQVILMINLIISSVVCYGTFAITLSSSNFKFHGFQEIALLSQFEHENIVQYYGTDKVLCCSF